MKKDKCLYALAYHQKMWLRRRPVQQMTPPARRKLALRRFAEKPLGDWDKCA